jgi:hypothetical protein
MLSCRKQTIQKTQQRQQQMLQGLMTARWPIKSRLKRTWKQGRRSMVRRWKMLRMSMKGRTMKACMRSQKLKFMSPRAQRRLMSRSSHRMTLMSRLLMKEKKARSPPRRKRLPMSMAPTWRTMLLRMKVLKNHSHRQRNHQMRKQLLMSIQQTRGRQGPRRSTLYQRSQKHKSRAASPLTDREVRRHQHEHQHLQSQRQR